jgi:hypothetical protein
VLSELWISLAALIRSYVAAHDIGRPVGRALVDNGDDGRLTIRGESRILAIEFDSGTGGGSWMLLKDDPGPEQVLGQGKFQLDCDSRIEFSDRRGKMDLEIAAEAFTARIFDED